jgi:hypothetical protein
MDAELNISTFLKALHWKSAGENEENQKERISIAGSVVQIRVPSVLLPSKHAWSAEYKLKIGRDVRTSRVFFISWNFLLKKLVELQLKKYM